MQSEQIKHTEQDMRTRRDTRTRCEWAGPDPICIDYHDNEWGVPVHHDRRLFDPSLTDNLFSYGKFVLPNRIKYSLQRNHSKIIYTCIA